MDAEVRSAAQATWEELELSKVNDENCSGSHVGGYAP